jgi:integrase
MQKYTKRADGRYQAKVYLGESEGRQTYKYIYAKSVKELETKLRDVYTQLGKGLDIAAQRDTFGSWAQRWLRLKQAEVSAHRYYVYQCRVKNLSALDTFEISKLRTMDIQDIILEFSNSYSKSVLREIKSTAKQICQLAVDNRVIDYNPADSVKIPSMAADTKTERRALTEEEQIWILNTKHRAQTAAMIMLYAGLRRGEVVPLLWSDIDLQAGTISVTKSMSRSSNNWTVKQGAKTKAGTRTVYIPRLLIDYLRDQERCSFLVCPDTRGHLMSLSAWDKLWTSYISTLNFEYGDFSSIMVTNPHSGLLEKFVKPKSRLAPKKIPIVIPKISPHWLRHTYITNLYLAGVDLLTAKEQAGHADINTTMEIYTHLDAVHKVKQIDKLNDFLTPKLTPIEKVF